MSKKLFDENSENRITPDFLKNQITDISYNVLNKKMTHCTITTKNEFTFTGEAVCVDIRNYDKEIGEKISYDNAFDEMWPCYGFALAQHIYESK